MVRRIQGGIAISFAIAAFAWGPQAAWAHGEKSGKTETLCQGFLPPNNLNIPVGLSLGIGRDGFDRVLDQAEKIYGPIIQKKGARLRVNRLWNDGTVNASADRRGNVWSINMYGGLARHSAINEEGFATVVCHELGHHLGGEPRYPVEWASNEGQADYFSTLKCMRFLYENEDNEAWIKTVKLDSFAANRCLQQFSDRADQLICMRSAYGSQSLSDMFAALDGGKKARFDTPDPRVVRRTDHAHQAAQCRMDTYFAGAICTVDKDEEIPSRGTKTGFCVEGIHDFGFRPHCWFKP